MKNLVIVIGGSSGIGYAIASALLLSGKHEVLNLSRHTASMIKCLKMDATDYRQVERAFWKVKNNYGTPKHMVYCAGVANPQGVLEIDRETWRKTIDTNLTGAFYCTQEFVKIAKKK